MRVDLTICEIENLLMMAEHCKKHFDHEYAKTAIKKIELARRDHINLYNRRDSGAEVDAMVEGFSLDFTGGKEQ